MPEPLNVIEMQEKALFNSFAALPLPFFVFNGTFTEVSASEISSVLMFGQKPVAMLTMPPVVAKAYANELLRLVRRYEDATQQVVPDQKEIVGRLQSP